MSMKMYLKTNDVSVHFDTVNKGDLHGYYSRIYNI